MVVLRSEYKEFVLTIVGGMSSTGTLRAGDILLRDDGSLEELIKQFRDGKPDDNTFIRVVWGRPSGSKRRSFSQKDICDMAARYDVESFVETFAEDVAAILGDAPVDLDLPAEHAAEERSGARHRAEAREAVGPESPVEEMSSGSDAREPRDGDA